MPYCANPTESFSKKAGFCIPSKYTIEKLQNLNLYQCQNECMKYNHNNKSTDCKSVDWYTPLSVHPDKDYAKGDCNLKNTTK